MTRRGRPRSARAALARVVQIKLRLYPGEDDDLIAFFSAVAPRLRATMVKQALRSGVQGELDVDESDVDELLDALDTFIF